METTRHFTATAYVVHNGATVLHRHPTLDLWLPPGGHLQRDELPHEAAIREAREETGLEVSIVQERLGAASQTARPIPQPAAIMLEDIDVHEEHIAHQHIDFIYYASAPDRRIDPHADEVAGTQWEWFDLGRIEADGRLEADVRAQAAAAVQAVEV